MKGMKIMFAGIILIVVALVLYFTVFQNKEKPVLQAKPVSSINYAYNDEGIMTNKETNEPFTGVLETRHENSYEINTYLNGLPHGEAARYSNSGILLEIGHYENGLQEGQFLAYSEEGILLNEGNFSKDEFHGVSRIYYPENGKLRQETYYTNGELDGVRKNYTEEGILVELTTYEMGLANGEALRFYPDGKPQIKAIFNKDYDHDNEFEINATYYDYEGNEVRGTFYLVETEE